MKQSERSPNRPVGDDDLTAYVDGELSAERSAFVEAWLKDHSEASDRIEADRPLNERLAGALAPLAETSLPARFRVENVENARRARRMARFNRIAAAFALLLAGAAGGWLANGWSRAQGPDGHLVADAVTAHRLFVAEKRHPVEVSADAKDHLGAWLGNRIGRPVEIPDLSPQGLTLVGGRLLPGENGPSGQIMYQNAAGERVTLYLQAGSGSESAFAFSGTGEAQALAWRSPELAFVLTGPLGREQLVTIAHAIYHGDAR